MATVQPFYTFNDLTKQDPSHFIKEKDNRSMPLRGESERSVAASIDDHNSRGGWGGGGGGAKAQSRYFTVPA